MNKGDKPSGVYIPITEYAKIHGLNPDSMRKKCQRGGYETAKKMGRDWLIDKDEPPKDLRVTSGKYVKNKTPKT